MRKSVDLVGHSHVYKRTVLLKTLNPYMFRPHWSIIWEYINWFCIKQLLKNILIFCHIDAFISYNVFNVLRIVHPFDLLGIDEFHVVRPMYHISVFTISTNKCAQLSFNSQRFQKHCLLIVVYNTNYFPP
jgi:hypothetical protein